MSTVSKKRKLGEDVQKFYAVKAGKTPGVYMSWAECQDNTTGFKGAVYKAFTSKQEAADFVAGKPGKGEEDRFYGVAVGHKTGVYTNWEEAKVQIEDVKGPKYKRFDTRAEAEEFVKNKGIMPKKTGTAKKADEETGEAIDEPSAKKAKTTRATRGKQPIQVYTDGACPGNGRKGAIAGVGVFFGVNDERNVSEPLAGKEQTNQRAELTGIIRALEIAPKDRDMEILTDSSYSIKCSTIWVASWIKKGWKTSTGADVMNKDLIANIKQLIEEREALGLETKFTFVKAHNGDVGNEAADKLAVAGAHAPRK